MATTAARLAFATMTTTAKACAWFIGLRRDITRNRLSEGECQELGLPEGSTVPAVHVDRLQGLPWWRVDCWTDEGDGKPGDACFNLQALGLHVEVYSKARRQEATAA